MVAVPAVGALFVSNLVMNDYQRLMQERRANNLPAAVGFVVALVCDTVGGCLRVHTVGGVGMVAGAAAPCSGRWDFRGTGCAGFLLLPFSLQTGSCKVEGDRCGSCVR